MSHINSTLLSNNCNNAKLLSESVPYKMLVILRAFTYIAAVGIFMALAINKPQTRIYHPNTRIVALITCLFMFLMALQGACFYIFEAWRVSFPYLDPCDRLWPTTVLFAMRSLNGIFLVGLNSSFVILCVERLICVCRISNYEKSSKPTLVALVMFMMTVLFSIVLILLLIPGVEWNKKVAVTTIRSSKNHFSFQIMLCYMFALECAGVLCFLFLHFWTQFYRKRIRGTKVSKNNCNLLFVKTNQTLSVKFQIEETIEMTRLFLPVVSAHCALSILTYLSALISNKIWPVHSLPTDRQMILYELTFVSRLSPLFAAVLLAHGTGRLRRILYCSTEQQMKISTIINSNKDQDDYFNRLKQMFETNAIAQRKK